MSGERIDHQLQIALVSCFRFNSLILSTIIFRLASLRFLDSIEFIEILVDGIASEAETNLWSLNGQPITFVLLISELFDKITSINVDDNTCCLVFLCLKSATRVGSLTELVKLKLAINLRRISPLVEFKSRFRSPTMNIGSDRSRFWMKFSKIR